MSLRLLIDECLTPELVDLAIDAGYVESTCLRDRGLLGAPDHEVSAWAIEHGFILVTRNAHDFRGRGVAGPGGLYAQQEIHPGLICLDSELSLAIDRQLDLFGMALGQIAGRPDLINLALEVSEHADGAVYVHSYTIPQDACAPPKEVSTRVRGPR